MLQQSNQKERTVKPKFPEVNTALHIIKGAIVKVLHTPITTTTDATKENEGRITVEYDGPEPGKDLLEKIEKFANDKILQNVDILYFKMNREEAEKKYKTAPVNETYLYDKFPVPAELIELQILEIPDWNVNCTVGPVLNKTGEVRILKIKRINHRVPKKEIEFIFELTAKKESAAKPNISKNEEIITTTPVKSHNLEFDDSRIVGDKVLLDFFTELKYHGIEISEEKEYAIRRTLTPKVENKIHIVKNTAYSRGFCCRNSNIPNMLK